MDNSEGIRAVISEPLDLISASLKEFAKNEEFMDITLINYSNGMHIKAHRVVLAAASGYFRNVLKSVSQQSEVVICVGREFGQLESIIKLIYEGEVQMSSVQEFEALKRACDELGIQNVDKDVVAMDKKNDDCSGMSKRKRGPRNHLVRVKSEETSELEQILRAPGPSQFQNEDLVQPLNFSLVPAHHANPPPAYKIKAEKHNGDEVDGHSEPLFSIRSEASLQGPASQSDQSYGAEQDSRSQQKGSPSMLASRNVGNLAEDFNNPLLSQRENDQVSSTEKKTDEFFMASGTMGESTTDVGCTSSFSKPAIAPLMITAPDAAASQPTLGSEKDVSTLASSKAQKQRKQRSRTGIKRKLPAHPTSFPLSPDFQAMIQSMAQQMTMQQGRIDNCNFNRSAALGSFAMPTPTSNFKLMPPMAGLQGTDKNLTSMSNSSRKSATTTSTASLNKNYTDLMRKPPVCKKGPKAAAPDRPSMNYGISSPSALPPQPKRVRTKLDVMRGLPGRYIATPKDGLQQQYLATDFQAGSPLSPQMTDSVSSTSQPRQTPKKSKPLHCDKCDKSFVYPKSYFDHLSTHDIQ